MQGAVLTRRIGNHGLQAATALGRLTRASMVYQDVPHHFRGNIQKVRAALPVNRLQFRQFEIEFVDQNSRLNSRARLVPEKDIPSHAMQFTVYHGGQPVQRGVIASAPVPEILGNGT